MTYTPELGQLCFGQPWQEHEVPAIMDAALCFIRDDLARARWNVYQTERPCPFGNTGEAFDCDAFSVRAYSWDDSDEQEWNFKCGDVMVSWYKYLGRGMSSNVQITPDMASRILRKCIDGIAAFEKEKSPFYMSD
ncbi:hypothetical protein JI664_23340 [Rhodobacter sp. NTK016B]|uniref:hypothetical protein n=1 Tax=Rhodobacter sp. NTK016B TaxID=2759676 RepID=UPI001A8DDAF9|nr:hypothetical protein [Rhodobacter sp. NTK016B]MBN8294925.1 hypothetical protein [Rhodobacter sp. NTK016B]